MKHPYYIILLTLVLNPVFGRAENQNFDEKFRNGTLTVNTTTKTGTTDLVTYTYSGGTAKFYAEPRTTGGAIALYMTGSGATVTTSQIADLDSLSITYLPAEDININVYTSPTGETGTWTAQTVRQPAKGTKTVKLPATGDYCLKITRPSTDFYILEIDYSIKPCHCLRVVSE